MILLAAALLFQGQTAGDTIIVTGERRKCSVRLADKVLSDPEFAARAAEWAAGRPVRVYAPKSSDYRCLTRIVLKLNDKGVRVIHFVDGRDAGAANPNWGEPSSR